MYSSAKADLIAWLHDHEIEMVRLLEQAVNIDSGSHYKAGVDRVADLFQEHLHAAGIRTARCRQGKHGDCVLGEIPGQRQMSDGHVLLLGHMDTVFPEGTARARPYRTEDGIAYGPGVADMKAGLVMNTFIARAFADLGSNTPPIRVLYTGDEEIASPSSRNFTMDTARGSLAVFNAEPGRPTGNVVSGRKGAFFIDFEVDGVAAHAGVNHDKGASAIEALARKIIALHALTDRQTGITANVGTLHGGMSVNTVADHAMAQLDIRFPADADRDHLHSRIVEIIENETLPCTCGRITHFANFLPFGTSVSSQDLLATYQTQARALGFEVQGEYTGGSADSGLTASVGAPTLCATGPVGGEVHTDREYCRIDTLVPRAQAVALTLLEISSRVR